MDNEHLIILVSILCIAIATILFVYSQFNPKPKEEKRIEDILNQFKKQLNSQTESTRRIKKTDRRLHIEKKIEKEKQDRLKNKEKEDEELIKRFEKEDEEYESEEELNFEEDENRNEELKKYILAKYPKRFESFQSSYKCGNCDCIIPKYNEKYICTECNSILCLDCFNLIKNSSSSSSKTLKIKKIHTHYSSETSFWVKETENSWNKKMKLWNLKNTSILVLEALKMYENRYFIAEKINNSKNDKFYTFKTINKYLQHFVNGIREKGIIWPREFVGICSEPRLEWIISDLACLHQSLISIPLQRIFEVSQMLYIINHSELKLLIISFYYFEKYKSILTKKKCPKLKTIVIMNLSINFRTEINEENEEIIKEKVKKLSEDSGINIVLMSDLIRIGKSTKQYLRQKTKLDKMITVMYTSGSTGNPKGVIFNELKWLDQLKYPLTLKTIVLYGYQPLSHIAGRIDIYTALFNGGRIHFTGEKNLNLFFQNCQRINPTAFGPVPRICNIVYKEFEEKVNKEIQNTKKTKNLELSTKEIKKIKRKYQKQYKNVFGNRISSIKISSAPIKTKIKNWLRKTLKIPVNIGYGSTEVGGISTNFRIINNVKLIDLPNLGYLTSNKPSQGEICVKNVRFESYFKNETENQKRFWIDPSTNEKYFRTGDIGELIEEEGNDGRKGKIRIIGRITNTIKLSQGEFVNLEKIEKLFEESKIIKNCFVYSDSFKDFCVGIILLNESFEEEEKKGGRRRKKRRENEVMEK